MAERVLIVDDDPIQRRLVENMVGKAGYETMTVDGGEAALKLMLATASPAYDCVVLDLVMPDLDGLGVLGRMRQAGLDIPVIVQTAHGGIDNVVTAMRAGAIDFVVKPVGFERLSVSLRNAMAARALAGEIARQKRSRSGMLTFRDIITRSPKMHAVLRVAEKTASSAIPVLIEGESGVGKELIARAIHGSGERRTKPFVAVNCGALPENLVESILFGHEKGAFTGAAERHDGKFVEASGGTLFLDEVGELPPAAQVKLLRAIQEGEVEPVGGKRPIKANARIVSATNRNLISDVQIRSLSRRSVLPPQCLPRHGAAPAGSCRGHPTTYPPFPGPVCGRGGQAHPVDVGRNAANAVALSLARECTAAGERHLPRGRARGRRGNHLRGIPPDCGPHRRCRCGRPTTR